MIGGTWPTHRRRVGAVLHAGDATRIRPELPDRGIQLDHSSAQAFDFGRNWFYQPICQPGHGGIAVTDLTTMHVIKTATLEQMYAGTPYGVPPGSPPSQEIHDLTCGTETDLYMLTAIRSTSSGEFCRFTRVDPVTMKVTGEFYVSDGLPPPQTCVMAANLGGVNTTATHTIVVYLTNGALPERTGDLRRHRHGADRPGAKPSTRQLRLVTTLSFLAPSTATAAATSYDQLDPDGGDRQHRDLAHQCHRRLAITSTKTGTVNVLLDLHAWLNLYIAQADYDTAHDSIILWLTNGSVTNGPPLWICR